MSRALTLALALALLSASAWASAEEPISATYQPVLDGYLVQFAVNNIFDSSVWYWFIATDDASVPTAPIGWHAYQTSREVGWRTEDIAYYVQPGESLGGFSYVSANPPGTLLWYVQGDGQTGAVTPVPVPEPSSLLALAAGIGGIGLGSLRKRRR